VGEMDDYESMDKSFSGFMIEQARGEMNGAVTDGEEKPAQQGRLCWCE